MSEFNELKYQRNFRLTNTAHAHLKKLANLHGMASRSDVIENVSRPDGVLVVIPRHILDIWLEEAQDKTSPRWQRAKELLDELKEYLPL
jgi:hypothetical protein